MVITLHHDFTCVPCVSGTISFYLPELPGLPASSEQHQLVSEGNWDSQQEIEPHLHIESQIEPRENLLNMSFTAVFLFVTNLYTCQESQSPRTPYAHFIHSCGILWLFKLHHMLTSFIVMGFYRFSNFTICSLRS